MPSSTVPVVCAAYLLFPLMIFPPTITPPFLSWVPPNRTSREHPLGWTRNTLLPLLTISPLSSGICRSPFDSRRSPLLFFPFLEAVTPRGMSDSSPIFFLCPTFSCAALSFCTPTHPRVPFSPLPRCLFYRLSFPSPAFLEPLRFKLHEPLSQLPLLPPEGSIFPAIIAFLFWLNPGFLAAFERRPGTFDPLFFLSPSNPPFFLGCAIHR